MINKAPIAILLLTGCPSLADWRSETGWNELEEWANLSSVTLATPSNVTVGMVEVPQASGGYIFNTDSSAFLGIDVITNVSAASNTVSTHAQTVALNFFGSSHSLSPEVEDVRLYEFNDFFVNHLQGLPTDSYDIDILSHAYIAGFDENPEASTKGSTQLLDAVTIDSKLLSIVGVNNGKSNLLPELWAHAYNNLSVGRSDGQHSSGTIPLGYEGAGRQKPEIVAPLDATSYATAAVSSMATLLKSQAITSGSANAQLPLTLKSILLAGAKKNHLADWQNTTGSPLDAIYGAGEANIYNSYRILHAGEQGSGNVNRHGWDYSTASFSTARYTITVPEYAKSANICANLSWQRTLRFGSYTSLTNLSLTLKNSANTVLFKSDSSANNLEHIWMTDLPAGDYTLEVTKVSGSNTPYVLAWRTSLLTDKSSYALSSTAGSHSLQYGSLLPNVTHFIERSTNLIDWNLLATTNSDNEGILNYSDQSASSQEPIFYRLRYHSP